MRDGSRLKGAVDGEKKEHIHLLLPRDLAAAVRALAAQERRPLVTQIEILLEQALRQDAVAA